MFLKSVQVFCKAAFLWKDEPALTFGKFIFAQSLSDAFQAGVRIFKVGSLWDSGSIKYFGISRKQQNRITEGKVFKLGEITENLIFDIFNLSEAALVLELSR